MPFRPINDRHAIQEVAFVLTYSRNFTDAEISRLEPAHDRWEADLPKMARGQVVTVMVGRGLPELPSPVAGISFERFKMDGSLDWRLRVNDNMIVVNCLTYTRWDDIWLRSRNLLHQASEVLNGDDNPIVGIGLQYIDVFIWEGAIAQYDEGQLLRRESDLIPKSIRERGPLWHLHQGWFRKEGLPQPGRLLERVHLDAVEQGGEQFVVKCDNTLRLDLAEGLQQQRLFGEDGPMIDRVFTELHEITKRTMSAYLNEEMAERINLNA